MARGTRPGQRFGGGGGGGGQGHPRYQESRLAGRIRAMSGPRVLFEIVVLGRISGRIDREQIIFEHVWVTLGMGTDAEQDCLTRM